MFIILTVKAVSVGSYATNCYYLYDDESGEAAAVDCAVYDEAYKNFMESTGSVKLKYILLTHGHFDHICGVYYLKKYFGGEVAVHEADALCLTSSEISLNNYADYSEQIPMSADILLSDGDILTLGRHEIKVMHVPGHTKGSVCYISGDKLFVGDTLFRGSAGRTDLEGGNARELIRSLKKIGELPGDYNVYPGHGFVTTLNDEREYNKYLRTCLCNSRL